LQRVARHREWHELRVRSNDYRYFVTRGPRRGLRVVIAAKPMNVDDVWFLFKLLQPLRNISAAQKRGPLARKNSGVCVVGVAACVARHHARSNTRGNSLLVKPVVKVPNVFCNTATCSARALCDMENVGLFGHGFVLCRQFERGRQTRGDHNRRHFDSILFILHADLRYSKGESVVHKLPLSGF